MSKQLTPEEMRTAMGKFLGGIILLVISGYLLWVGHIMFGWFK